MSKRKPAVEERSEETNGRAIKRRKNYSTADAELARYYKALSSESAQERENAITEVTTTVDKALQPGQSEQTSSLVDLDKPKNIYVRLARGCCSGRQAANKGFSDALMAALRASARNDGLRHRIIDIVEACTKPGDDATRAEKRDCARGRLAAYGSILRSHFYTTSAESARADSTFLKTLICFSGVCRENRFLQPLYGSILFQVITDFGHIAAPQVLYGAVVQSMCAHGLARTPEGIAIWSHVQSVSPKTKLPKDVWHHRKPFSSKEFHAVIKIMRHGQDLDREIDPDDKAVDLTGAKQIRPSFYWDAILSNLASLFSTDEQSLPNEIDGRDSLYDRFWTEAIDQSFFASSASTDRKCLGFQILKSQLSVAPSWALGIILSQRLQGCLINHCADSNRNLHKVSKNVLNAILLRASKGTVPAVTILRHLLFSEAGTVTFDKRTSKSGVKLAQAIMGQADNETLVTMTRLIETKFEAAESLDPAEANQTRQALADLVLETVRNQSRSLKESLRAGQSVPEWPSEMLASLATASFKPRNSSDDLLDKAFDMMKSRLNSIIGVIIGLGYEIARPTLMDLLTGLRRIPARNLELTSRGNAEDLASLERAVAIATTINLKDNTHDVDKALLMLLSVTIFQAYAGDAEAIPLVRELSDYHDSSSDTHDADANSNDSMIELLLSLAAKPSQAYRKLIEHVFGAFCTSLSSESLQSMLDILEHKENTAGQRALFEAGADEKDDIVEEVVPSANDESFDSDVELISEAVEEEVDGIKSASDSSSDSDNDSAQSANSADQRLDDALAEMLGTNGASKSAGETHVKDSDTDSDASMNDDEMLALEPHLAAAFRARTNAIPTDDTTSAKAPPSASAKRKKDHAAAKTNMLNFKNRVLDLLTIWLKQDPTNKLTLEVVLPLLRLVRTTSSRQIAQKTAGVLRTYFDAAKGKGSSFLDGSSAEDIQDLSELLKEIHEEALRFGSKLHASTCSRASLFGARCLLVFSPSASQHSMYPEAKDGETNRDVTNQPPDRDKKRKRTNGTLPATQSSGDDVARALRWDMLIDLYASTQRKRRRQKSGLPPSFWRDFIDWETSTKV